MLILKNATGVNSTNKQKELTKCEIYNTGTNNNQEQTKVVDKNLTNRFIDTYNYLRNYFNI